MCAKYAIVSHILHMWIPRDAEGRLKRSAKTRPVMVLTGARQTDKTPFRHLFPDYAFVSRAAQLDDGIFQTLVLTAASSCPRRAISLHLASPETRLMRRPPSIELKAPSIPSSDCLTADPSGLMAIEPGDVAEA